MVEENYFVGIKSPTALRRELLEASRDTLKLLQKHYDIMDLRKQKEEEIHKLENQVKEIIVLYNKLEGYLPEKSVLSKKRTSDIKPVKPHKPTAKKEKPKPVVKEKELSKLEKLEQALSSIESKLNALD